MMRTDDRGAAMILALLTTLLLAGLGLSLTLLGDMERRIASNFRLDHEVWFAVDAAIERAAADLARTPDWDVVLAGAVQSTFVDSTRAPVLRSGGTINLDALTADLQRSTSAAASFGADTPLWRLYAWGPLTRMTPTPAAGDPYLVAWVADDVLEADGNPSDDSNGIVTIHALAFGPGGARRAAEAHVRRAGGALTILARRDL